MATKLKTMVWPTIGKKYRLTYLAETTARGREIISQDFTFMCKRRSGYYFLSENGVIDLTIRYDQFEDYLKNTVECLQK